MMRTMMTLRRSSGAAGSAGKSSKARSILTQHRPMTLRQIHYQLVSHYGRANTEGAYDTLSKWLTKAREIGRHSVGVDGGPPAPSARFVDVSSIADFAHDVVPQYRRNIWANQPRYFEFWC